MKKFILLSFLLIGIFTTLKINAANPYAIFNYATFDGKTFTQKDFDLNTDKRVKKLVVTELDEVFDNTVTYFFDENQRLIKVDDEAYFSCYAPSRTQIIYDENGRLDKEIYTYLEDLCDSGITPYVECCYTYDWKGDKLESILERIKIDNGLNYVGEPTHLKIVYSPEGKPAEAICVENPNVKFIFNKKGDVINRSYYRVNYPMDSDWYTPEDGLQLDDLFWRGVNFDKKMPLEWEIEKYDSDENGGADDYNSIPKKNLTYGPKDKYGNWTRKIEKFTYPGYDEIRETETTREIEYY